MDQIKQLLAGLSLRQKISIVTALVLTGALMYGVLHWRKEQDFRPLFTELAPEDASAVVHKLKESGIDYRLSENGTAVLAPSASINETRLLLAGEGLPKTGRIGFELFDKSNFGVTDFTEHVNFRRALEGELARSILSLAEVQDARVHITFPKDSVFVESRQEGKASVIVRLRPGRQLTTANVTAIAHLVSSAVEGLAPDAVSVLDSRGTLLSRPRRADTAGDASGPLLDYKQELERDLSAKINQTLEPIVGTGRYRVGVNVECDYSTTEQSEEVIDPSKSAIVTAQKTEEGPSSSATADGGIPGTASNLPRPTAPAIVRTGSPLRRTENVTYQSSRTVKLVKVPRGTINRLSVAVLIDYQTRWEGSGSNAKRTLAPPPPERLKTIRDLVAGVAGVSTERGDQLIVDTLAFESTLNDMADQQAPPVAPIESSDTFSFTNLQKNYQVPLAAGLILVIVLVLMMRRKPRTRNTPAAVAVEPGVKQIAAGTQSESAAEHVGKALTAKLEEQEAVRAQLEAETLNALKLPTVTTKRSEVLTKHLRDEMKKDPKAAAQLIRTWLAEDEA